MYYICIYLYNSIDHMYYSMSLHYVILCVSNIYIYNAQYILGIDEIYVSAQYESAFFLHKVHIC